MICSKVFPYMTNLELDSKIVKTANMNLKCRSAPPASK